MTHTQDCPIHSGRVCDCGADQSPLAVGAPVDAATERAAFEAWALSEKGGYWPEAVAREGDGYKARAVTKHWKGWQARAALSYFACKGSPGECTYNGACMYACGNPPAHPSDALREAPRLADELERDKWHVSAVTLQRAADCLRALAHPAPTAAPADGGRVPMTPDEVFACNELMSANARIGTSIHNLMQVVRAVELHHGIAPN